MKDFRTLSIINVMGFILVIVVNYLSQVGGETTGQISDSIDILFKPANYAFAIWGLIYLLLAIWIGKQFFANAKQKQMYENVGYWFFLNNVLNSLWVILFGNKLFNLTLLCIIGVLITLIITYMRIQRSPVSFLYRIPFSIYLGWVSVATIVNVFVVFEVNGIDSLFGLNEMAWTIIMLFIGGSLSFWFTFKNSDVFYPLVTIWAYIAIVVKQGETNTISKTAMMMVIIIAIGIIIQLIRIIRKRRA